MKEILLDIWYVYRKSNAGIPGVWVYKLGYGAAIEEPNPDIIAEEPGKYHNGKHIVAQIH